MERRVVEQEEGRDSPELLRFREVDRYSIRDVNKIDHPLSKEVGNATDDDVSVYLFAALMLHFFKELIPVGGIKAEESPPYLVSTLFLFYHAHHFRPLSSSNI